MFKSVGSGETGSCQDSLRIHLLRQFLEGDFNFVCERVHIWLNDEETRSVSARRRRFYAVLRFFYSMLRVIESQHHEIKDQVCIKYNLIEACLSEAKRLESYKGAANQRKKFTLLAMLNVCLCRGADDEREMEDLTLEDVDEDEVEPLIDYQIQRLSFQEFNARGGHAIVEAMQFELDSPLEICHAKFMNKFQI